MTSPRTRPWKGTPAALALIVSRLIAAEPVLIAKWSFDNGAASDVAGIPSGKVERATTVDGHLGKALQFEDWSIQNYLKPDPSIATRVVVPHDPKLNPPLPFRVTAWIYPTADPVYYGGIVEKGQGYGASYRLVLLRGLKVEASLGDKLVAVRSVKPVSLNEWHEVALVADGKGLVLMVDGAEAGRAGLQSPIRLTSTAPLVIGERFTGKIDEVTIGSE